MIYFDSAATSFQKPASVRRAVLSAMVAMSSPARGDYPPARRAGECVYGCREEAAGLFGMNNCEEVVFTSNATHGLNIAIRTLVEPGSRVVISGYEHNAVTRCLAAIPETEIKVAISPLFDKTAAAEAFERLIGPDTDAVICCHVSNVFGYRLPVEEVAEICRRRGKPLIVDASQSAGSCAVEAGKWQAAFVAMPGHKGLMGPQGTGLLLCGAETKPLICGGTGSESLQQQMPMFLPDRLEAGTHNVPGIAGLGEGIRFVKKLGFTEIEKRKDRLCRLFLRELRELPRTRVFAAGDGEGQCGVVSAVFEDLESEEMAEELARRGIAVRAGYHCAPLAHQTAGTARGGTVRFSFSVFNTADEIGRTGEALRDILRRKC